MHLAIKTYSFMIRSTFCFLHSRCLVNKLSKRPRAHRAFIIIAGFVVPAHFGHRIRAVGVNTFDISDVSIRDGDRAGLRCCAGRFAGALCGADPVITSVAVHCNIRTAAMHVVGTPHAVTNVVAV